MSAGCPSLATFIVFIIAAVGCSSQSTERSRKSKQSADGAEAHSRAELRVGTVSSVHEGAPVTDDEAIAVGNAIASAIIAGDVESYCAEFDWDAFGALIVAGLPNDTPEAGFYRESIKKGAKNGGPPFAERLIREVTRGGSAKVLRVRETESGKSVLIRFLTADDGLNYHEFFLARRSGGVRAVDSYDYLSALRQSEAIQQVGIATLPYKAELVPSLRVASLQLIRQQNEHLMGMLEGMQKGEPQKVLDHYEAINPAVQRQKRAMLMRIMALQQLNQDEYRAAIDDYRSQYPDDASVCMIGLYDYIDRGWFEEAHANIDKVDQAIGGDPGPARTLGHPGKMGILALWCFD